jgi:uncharacterized RDD family membrane protein YckC
MEASLKKRILALVIDFIVISALMWILMVIIYPLIILTGSFAIYNYGIPILAILILLYFALLEGYQGSTLGKSILGIQVKSLNGELTYKQTFIRSLSKILWLPLIIDFFGALLTSTKSLRLLDKYARTEVVLVSEKPTQKPE